MQVQLGGEGRSDSRPQPTQARPAKRGGAPTRPPQPRRTSWGSPSSKASTFSSSSREPGRGRASTASMAPCAVPSERASFFLLSVLVSKRLRSTQEGWGEVRGRERGGMGAELRVDCAAGKRMLAWRRSIGAWPHALQPQPWRFSPRRRLLALEHIIKRRLSEAGRAQGAPAAVPWPENWQEELVKLLQPASPPRDGSQTSTHAPLTHSRARERPREAEASCPPLAPARATAARASWARRSTFEHQKRTCDQVLCLQVA